MIQPELQLQQEPRVEPKVFRAAKGRRALRYWDLPDNVTRVELRDGVLVTVTRQGTGPSGHPRLYTNVPGFGSVQNRNKKTMLATLSLIAEALENLVQENFAELEAENARLRDKNARLRDELTTAQTLKPKPEGSSPLRHNVRLLRPELVVRFGVPAAMVLQQVCFVWRTTEGGILDGQRYVSNTYEEWVDKYFPFYSVPTLERAFKRLENEKLVLSKQPDGRKSRRKCYRPTPEAIKMMDSGERKPSRWDDANHQNEGVKPSKWDVPSKEESKSTARAAAATAIDDDAWLSQLANKHGFSKEKEWERFLTWCKKVNKEPSRRLFEGSHLPRIEEPAKPKIRRTAEIEPAQFPNWFAISYPNQPRPPWSEAPSWMKDEFTRTTTRTNVKAG